VEIKPWASLFASHVIPDHGPTKESTVAIGRFHSKPCPAILSEIGIFRQSSIQHYQMLSKFDDLPLAWDSSRVSASLPVW
jgi:hypothetical protein